MSRLSRHRRLQEQVDPGAVAASAEHQLQSLEHVTPDSGAQRSVRRHAFRRWLSQLHRLHHLGLEIILADISRTDAAGLDWALRADAFLTTKSCGPEFSGNSHDFERTKCPEGFVGDRKSSRTGSRIAVALASLRAKSSGSMVHMTWNELTSWAARSLAPAS